MRKEKQVGAHGNRHREGETRAEADQRVAIANGHASEADYRKARERAYTKKTAPQGSQKAIIRLRLVPCCSSSIFGLSRGVEKTLVLMGVWTRFTAWHATTDHGAFFRIVQAVAFPCCPPTVRVQHGSAALVDVSL